MNFAYPGLFQNFLTFIPRWPEARDNTENIPGVFYQFLLSFDFPLHFPCILCLQFCCILFPGTHKNLSVWMSIKHQIELIIFCTAHENGEIFHLGCFVFSKQFCMAWPGSHKSYQQLLKPDRSTHTEDQLRRLYLYR